MVRVEWRGVWRRRKKLLSDSVSKNGAKEVSQTKTTTPKVDKIRIKNNHSVKKTCYIKVDNVRHYHMIITANSLCFKRK